MAQFALVAAAWSESAFRQKRRQRSAEGIASPAGVDGDDSDARDVSRAPRADDQGARGPRVTITVVGPRARKDSAAAATSSNEWVGRPVNCCNSDSFGTHTSMLPSNSSGSSRAGAGLSRHSDTSRVCNLERLGQRFDHCLARGQDDRTEPQQVADRPDVVGSQAKIRAGHADDRVLARVIDQDGRGAGRPVGVSSEMGDVDAFAAKLVADGAAEVIRPDLADE